MVTNCSAEHSFSRLKYIKNPIRTTMQQGRLDALSLLSIEADVLHTISFEDLIKDFAIKKVGENFFNINKVEVCKNKHDFPSYCKFCLISINRILFYDLLLFKFGLHICGGTKIF